MSEAHATDTRPTGDFLQYGGQAVIEGVMMRSPRYFAVACRRPDGSIVTQCEEVDKSFVRRLKWMNRPFLRGTLALLDAMILGNRALAFASRVQLQATSESAEQDRRSTAGAALPTAVTADAATVIAGTPMHVARDRTSERINDIAVGGTIVLSLLFGFLLFRALPTLLTEFIEHRSAFGAASYVAKNALDGLIRAGIFFTYILLISRLSGIRAVFQYHGAEHKAINTLEAQMPLTLENALRASRIHPRCGTSFIIVVLAVDFLICLFLPRPVWYLRIPLHMAVMPPVAGIAYECIKFAGKFRQSPLVMAAFAPGMWSQLLTTREPTPDQVEVALTALYAVLEAEGHHEYIPGRVANPAPPDPLEPAVAVV